jgi:hypothetical protein
MNGYGDFNIAMTGFGAGHALLFNCYANPSQGSGDFSLAGNVLNTNYANSYGGGPGMLMYSGNGGVFQLLIGPQSPGPGTGVNWNQTNPAQIWHRNGNTAIGTDLTTTYKLRVQGQPAAAGYTQFANYSDSRLKDNILDLESSLARILKLRPVEFEYNELYHSKHGSKKDGRRIKGFIAQEIQKVFPEMVHSVDLRDEVYLDTNLSDLVIHLVKAIQELNSKIGVLNG